MFTAQLLGATETRAAIVRLQEGVAAAASAEIVIGTDVIYAFGIETGYRRDGRLARAAGGSFALTNAFAAVQPTVRDALIPALAKGADAVHAVMQAKADEVRDGASTDSPVRSGTLAGSFITVPGWI